MKFIILSILFISVLNVLCETDPNVENQEIVVNEIKDGYNFWGKLNIIEKVIFIQENGDEYTAILVNHEASNYVIKVYNSYFNQVQRLPILTSNDNIAFNLRASNNFTSGNTVDIVVRIGTHGNASDMIFLWSSHGEHFIRLRNGMPILGIEFTHENGNSVSADVSLNDLGIYMIKIQGQTKQTQVIQIDYPRGVIQIRSQDLNDDGYMDILINRDAGVNWDSGEPQQGQQYSLYIWDSENQIYVEFVDFEGLIHP